jgi:hypothetical protein
MRVFNHVSAIQPISSWGEEAVRTTIGWTQPRIHLRHSSLAQARRGIQRWHGVLDPTPSLCEGWDDDSVTLREGWDDDSVTLREGWDDESVTLREGWDDVFRNSPRNPVL